jgi:hypothetical protein
MALTYGALLMGKDKRDDLKQIQKEQKKAAKKARKRGLWSSIGGSLGSLGAGLLFSGMGPMGMMAAKMAMGRLGREIGQHSAGSVDTSKIKGEHGFYKDIAKDARDEITDFDKMIDKEQWMSSVVNPVIEMGTAEALKMGKDFAGDTKLGQWVEKQRGKGTDLLKGKKGFHWMHKGVTDPETGVDIGSLMRSGMSLGDYQQLISDRQSSYVEPEFDWNYDMEVPIQNPYVFGSENTGPYVFGSETGE